MLITSNTVSLFRQVAFNQLSPTKVQKAWEREYNFKNQGKQFKKSISYHTPHRGWRAEPKQPPACRRVWVFGKCPSEESWACHSGPGDWDKWWRHTLCLPFPASNSWRRALWNEKYDMGSWATELKGIKIPHWATAEGNNKLFKSTTEMTGITNVSISKRLR